MSLKGKLECFKGIDGHTYYGYKKKYVKEFIKELKEKSCGCQLCEDWLWWIDELAGKELVEDSE